MRRGRRRDARRREAIERVRAAAGGITLGSHAADRAEELGFHESEVLACVARPETVYPGAPEHGPGRRVYRRGVCACVVSEATGEVVTVLLNTGGVWRHGTDTRRSVTTSGT